MTKNRFVSALVLTSATIAIASCGSSATGENTSTASTAVTTVDMDAATETVGPFAARDLGTFAEPWAAAFVPGTEMLVITEKAGTIQAVDMASGNRFSISGAPEVDYGGQGGLGDVAFLPSEADSDPANRTIYLSWAEAGEDDTRGAVVGKGMLVCSAATTCAIEGLEVIWQQTPKVTGRGHYSHRIAFSPDGQYLFVSSGDRQKLEPAQDNTNTIGTVVRLNLDGTPASGNPFADQGSPTDQIWSYGHRNVLGLAFDGEGRLWDLEHGPAGGDELNLVERGANYGWPTRSYGNHYRGTPIADHTEDDGFNKPAIWWTPVVAPGDFMFYSGDMFAAWKGDAIIAGLRPQQLIRVEMNGTSATEAERYDMGARMREVLQGPDGAIYVLEDGDDGRLRQLTPAG